jgi:hypothetical protein
MTTATSGVLARFPLLLLSSISIQYSVMVIRGVCCRNALQTIRNAEPMTTLVYTVVAQLM